MNTEILQIRKKGTLTLPSELRSKYGLGEGDILTLIDLGDGSFLLTPKISQVDRLGSRIAEKLSQEGVSLEELLSALDEEREEYYRENYADQ